MPVATVLREDLTNWVNNGFGELGNNTNFAATTYDAADKPAAEPTVAGSFVFTANAQIVWTTDTYLVDFVAQYALSFWLRQRTAGDAAQALVGLAPYDRGGNVINPIHYMWQQNTTTTLAQPLNVGDTVMYLTSAANWRQTAGASTHLRNIVFWNWVDSFGTTWPQHTYTRWVVSNGYLDGAVNYTTNAITLRVPYPGPAHPAGRPVSNGSSGSNYMYGTYGGLLTFTPPSTWTKYGPAYYQGLHTNGLLAATTSFPHGTHSARPIFLLNRSNSTSRHALAGVTFRQSSLRQATVRRWNGAEWVAATVNRGAPANPAADAQLLGWDFTGTGASVPDTTGNNRVGTLSDAAMRVSGAITVSASSHRLVFLSDAATRPTYCSISCWVNVSPTGAGGEGYPMHHARIYDSTTFGMWMHRSGSDVEVQAVVRSANNVRVFTAPTFSQDAWHHLALVYDGANAYLYVDGVVKASAATTGSLTWGTEPERWSWQIGNHQHMPAGMTGYQVDDVRLYNRGLSASEVSSLGSART